jgi:predicted Fe-Mo cluster-binding NifX family protein
VNETPKHLIVAFATVDNHLMPKMHFGEAPEIALYRIGATTSVKMRSIPNRYARDKHANEAHLSHGQTEEHRDNGESIGRFLASAGVHAMVSRAFGPNIRQMQRRFLPITVRCDEITQAIAVLQSHWPLVWKSWTQGGERRHLVLPRQAATAMVERARGRSPVSSAARTEIEDRSSGIPSPSWGGKP